MFKATRKELLQIIVFLTIVVIFFVVSTIIANCNVRKLETELAQQEETYNFNFKDYEYTLLVVTAREEFNLEGEHYYMYQFRKYHSHIYYNTWYIETQFFSIDELVLVVALTEDNYLFIALS